MDQSVDFGSQGSKFNIHNKYGMGSKKRQGYQRSPLKQKNHDGECIKVKTKPRHKYGNTVVIDKQLVDMEYVFQECEI